MAATHRPLRKALAFIARFALLAPVCLVLWWLALPVYARVLGTVAGLVLRIAPGLPIDGVAVKPDGILNTRTVLTLTGINQGIAIGELTSNIAPFIALVLATGGLPMRRRLFGLLAGTAVLAACHLLFLTIAFAFAEPLARAPQLPTALGQLFITLPFLLWVVLVYWGRRAPETGGSVPEEKEPAQQVVPSEGSD